MSKILVITEKPSVAADITRALGGKATRSDFFEVQDYIITSAVGHLLELCLPNKMLGGKGIPWSLDKLPIIPVIFDLQPVVKTGTRLNFIKKLLNDKTIKLVINACDAGREGELIFNNIMKFCRSKKQTKRLWLQSMTRESVLSGFKNLRKGEEMKNLADAAVCRAESDWLVGINSTRAFTAINSSAKSFQLTPVGRVQTPTLAILATREEAILNFQPKTYYEIHADIQIPSGMYTGKWVDKNFKKSSENHEQKAERIWNSELAEHILSCCTGNIEDIIEKKKSTTQSAPHLYDLTTLQREANSRFGFSAKRTLQLAQRLYEHYKVLTYPRTDCRYLPEDSILEVKRIFQSFHDTQLHRYSQEVLAKNWIIKTDKVFNNAKLSDHHAIIPTGVVTDNLDEFELKLFNMVSQRLIAIFYPIAHFDITTRFTIINDQLFKSEGKILRDAGWMSVYGKESNNLETSKLLVSFPPEFDTKKKIKVSEVKKIQIHEYQTHPPAHFSEATLLSAMEGAGKLLEDEELREAMSQRGLGTPATRASIIEGLISDGYILREEKELFATNKGIALIHLLRHIGVAELTSPELTGEWEFKLKQIESGKFNRDSFMADIREFTAHIVSKAQNFTDDGQGSEFKKLVATCPKCGNHNFSETIRQFYCTSCRYAIWKAVAGRILERLEIEELLNNKKVGPLEGFRSRFGKKFTAHLILDGEGVVKFLFETQEHDEVTKEELQNADIIYNCPICKTGKVRDASTSYLCDKIENEKKVCPFRIGKTILQSTISKAEVKKILMDGKSNLLFFTSKKGKKFAAYLVIKDGKVVFEFENSNLKDKNSDQIPKKETKKRIEKSKKKSRN